MAKKSSFNMAAAIRDALQVNPNLSLKEALEAVQTQHPKQKINVSSFGVALTGARKRLGIATGRKKSKRVPVQRTSDNLEGLLAAKRFIAAVGGAEKAAELVRTVSQLQIR